jgi:hypothetical protein
VTLDTFNNLDFISYFQNPAPKITEITKQVLQHIKPPFASFFRKFIMETKDVEIADQPIEDKYELFDIDSDRQDSAKKR